MDEESHLQRPSPSLTYLQLPGAVQNMKRAPPAEVCKSRVEIDTDATICPGGQNDWLISCWADTSSWRVKVTVRTPRGAAQGQNRCDMVYNLVNTFLPRKEETDAA